MRVGSGVERRRVPPRAGSPAWKALPALPPPPTEGRGGAAGPTWGAEGADSCAQPLGETVS